MNDKALPAWDLSDLYDGIEDEKIAADLEKYRAFCVEFAGRYKGRLSELDGAGIAAALKAYEQNSEIGSRVGRFCLSQHGNADEKPGGGRFLSEYQRKADRLQQAADFPQSGN